MKFLSLFILLLSISACATSGDFNYLSRDINDLRKQSAESKKEIDILKEKTSGIVKEESFSAVRESQADMTSRLSETANNLQELRGRFEENKYSIEKTLKDSSTEKDLVRAQIADLETQVRNLKDRLASIEEAAKTKEATQKSGEAHPDTEKATTPSEPEQNGQASREAASPSVSEEKKDGGDDWLRAYESAYQAFKDKQFKEAREKFESFIKAQPRNKLAGNAQFWIAETYYAEKDYEGAILAYETLLKKYPDSEKTSGALLKQGFAFIEIGDNKTGKTILNRLIEKFPSSKDASLAKKKISDLDRKAPRKK